MQNSTTNKFEYECLNPNKSINHAALKQERRVFSIISFRETYNKLFNESLDKGKKIGYNNN